MPPSIFPLTTSAYIARSPSQTPQLEPITYNTLDSDEVLVDIIAVSICHTDVKTAKGEFHIKPPVIIGHEASGVVREIGEKVRDVGVGDRVVLSYASCGKCRRCVKGGNAYCDEIFGLNFGGKEIDLEGGGKVSGSFFGQGSLSRVARVRENCCVKVEVEVEGEEEGEEELRGFASLGCGIQTGAGAILNVAKPPPGSSIAIWGGGAVGLSALLAAKPTSPSLLVLIDNSQTKLGIIPKSFLFGVQVINSSTLEAGETASKIISLSPGAHGIDYALDCVGSTAVIQEAHACLDKLGTLINVGSSATAKIDVPVASQLVRGITVRGTHQGDSVSRVMVPCLIDLWRQGKFPFDLMLKRYRFEELDRAWEDMREGRVVKALLVV